jgi:hypothetical protein
MAHKALFGALLTLAAFGADNKLAVVKQLSVRPRLDGDLSDSAWAETTPIGAFTQREPKSGAPPTESTEVWLGFTKDHLYIAVRCIDSRPDSIFATQMTRDANLDRDDRIEILLDTFQDGRNAYYFATNPAGALVDGTITESGKPKLEWDGVWNVRTKISRDGWTAEIEIPFKSLSFNPRQSQWGFNISRTLARMREESRWASPSFDIQFNQVAMAGTIEGLSGLSQGIGLDVKPWGLLGFTRDISRADQASWEGDGGVDVFWRVTSNLVSSTTVNTDFAETEVDTRQINLTRFPLFFPEKRVFFLENAGIFEFAQNARDQEFVPFFSRTMGLVNGKEVPILVGTKLTGKVGRFDVGLMDVMTRDSDVAPGRNFVVGRIKANFWDQSYLGALFTEGEPTGKTRNRVGGVDLKLFTSNFLNHRKNIGLMLFGTKSATPELKGRDTGYGAEFTYPNDFVDVGYRWRVLGENYNPALGFVARKGNRFQELRTNLRPRPKFWHIRQMNFQFNYTEYFNLAYHAIESRKIFTAPVNWRFHNGAHVEYNWQPTFERLFVPFNIHPGISIPVGSYWTTRHRVEFNTAQNKHLMFDMTYWGGSFYTGSSNELRTAVLWRKDRHLSTSLELQQYFVQLKEGDFTTRLALYKLDYAFTPYLSVSNFVQYDTQSRNIGLQSRARWIWTPGNEMYFVFNHAWQQDPLDRFETIRTNFRAKLNYTFRF